MLPIKSCSPCIWNEWIPNRWCIVAVLLSQKIKICARFWKYYINTNLFNILAWIFVYVECVYIDVDDCSYVKHCFSYVKSCRMSKIRRKVTVENSKTISDSSSSSSTTTSSTSNPAAPSRRPSVFERLGPSTGSNAADVCTACEIFTWKTYEPVDCLSFCDFPCQNRKG